MKTAEQLAKVEELIGLMSQYFKLAVANKATLSAEQLGKAKQNKATFLLAQKVKKSLQASLKSESKENKTEQLDPQVKKFMKEAQDMLDAFDKDMEAIQKAIKATETESIKGGKALLSKI